MKEDPERPDARVGVLCAGGAFFIWGIVPLYFARLAAVPPLEIIAHRVIWSVVFLGGLLAVTQRFAVLRAVLRDRATLAGLALSTVLVASNWLLFVWAVNAGRVLETSLGYFMTPKVNVLLGFLFLGERLRRLQWVAVALAAAGVANQVVQLGRLPWVSLLLALTFGGYGLARKRIRIDGVNGLLTETLLATPVALAYLGYLAWTDRLRFGHVSRPLDLGLVFLGVVTSVPLVLFAAGARRLRLATIGFMQYLAPSMTFLLAVFVFREPLGATQAFTFTLIWAGVLLYALDTVRAGRS